MPTLEIQLEDNESAVRIIINGEPRGSLSIGPQTGPALRDILLLEMGRRPRDELPLAPWREANFLGVPPNVPITKLAPRDRRLAASKVKKVSLDSLMETFELGD